MTNLIDSGSDYITNIHDRARNFLIGILAHYPGSAEEKLEKSKKFIDEILFQSQYDLNPFSNSMRETFDIAYYSRYVLVPEMIEKIKQYKNSEPFSIHDWN